ncbi:preprotein translocase subunit SecE [Patescibacteria group bacterium]|nr:preprotein translocase subunit SecE [Patescibacteria group bacterium]MBU1705694.1 preprotein translocase subunit SecE [Patescibacteria group bacterium]
MYSSTRPSNPLAWFARYLRDAKEELGKVTWPSKQDTIRYSVVVIAISVFVAAFFGGLDWVFNLGLEELIKLAA